ncbi:MAG: DUF177 domain-containing protein [Rhodospirillaceae bacterium]|nr:DUF177 domain-containing protein [Rhodospirillaceae bacterium]
MIDNKQEISPETSEITEDIAPELSRVIKVDALKGDHFELEITANEEERLALATRFDLIDLKFLTASLVFTFPPTKSDIHVKANFKAAVIQRCGVTLEPVPADIEGEFWCDYSQEFSTEDVEIIEFDEQTEDPPEAIVDGEFDVGIMLTEQFGLELDPFPRAPEADFDAIRKATNGKLDDPDSNNPFAVLKKLK